ncbi:SDR family NAD(P)-dependent oxidoreductase [Sneathiella marina]|uniref:SDR family NAD(P)-dependent oxidoreductase n=1 Tax=Sneathiella marina TaxID=2950108 RepID=A0ABY4VZF0_9PROT|nr:SDR family NAD(P)-dependent oxidoreductase [Sneathiella marina]USG60283.1 SDR family NAD(P)-dependent oxidoreductase [Sneathiella marina]
MTNMDNGTRRVLVTGGTAGIGFATAQLLAKKGHKVFICGRDQSRVDAAIGKLRSFTKDEFVAGSACDIRQFSEVENMMRLVEENFGGLDILVNNAGIGTIASIEDLAPEDWHEMLDVNLTGTFNCTKVALPLLKKSTHANIINLGSRAGRYAFEGGTAYNSTKFGLQGFTEALFLDLHKYEIGVSLIAPGTVATGFAGIEEEDWQLQPDDIAKIIVDQLSNHKRANANWIEIRPGIRR